MFLSASVNPAEVAPLFVLILVLIAFIVFCIKMVGKTSKAKKTQKERVNQLKASGMLLQDTFAHVSGLSIAENVFCTMRSYADRYEIHANGAEMNLQRSKVTDVSIKTDTEIQTQYVSSVGGAVGGAVLFGPLGAIIGGRAKQKKTKTVSQYLIITYWSGENELKYICFDVTGRVYSAAKFVDEFVKSRPAEARKIEL